jgi:serine phosphatase RsbU (regulator of sigma subunit)
MNERAFYRMLLDAHMLQAKNQKGFLDLIIQKSDEAAQKAPQDDDITVVVLDFH